MARPSPRWYPLNSLQLFACMHPLNGMNILQIHSYADHLDQSHHNEVRGAKQEQSEG